MAETHALTSKDRYMIRSVKRALEILRTLSDGANEMSAAEISRQMKLSQSTTFRLLVTLSSHNFVEQNPDNGKYRLGYACIALSDAFKKGRDLHNCSVSSIRHLRDSTGETIHLGILENKAVIYVDKLDGLYPIGLMASRVGGQAPIHCTALGKALLAQKSEAELTQHLVGIELRPYTANTITNPDKLRDELAKVREQGYALDNEEHEEGVACIAAPIYDHEGVVGAISASGPVSRIYEKISRNDLVDTVKKAACEISLHLGGVPDQ